MPKQKEITISKKQMASGALFFNNDQRLLILHPTYKSSWEIPGGMIEESESPKEALKRELQEELGLNKSIGRLLVCDYWHASEERPDSLQFIFSGGVLSDEEIEGLVLEEKEIESFEFVSVSSREERSSLATRPRVGPRVLMALEAIDKNECYYLENAKIADFF